MDIIHRVSFNSKKDPDFDQFIRQSQIPYKAILLPGGGSELITFTITESDRNWPRISNLMLQCGAVDLIETIFTDSEIRNAEWLRLKSTFERGYPQPKMNWPIKQSSYQIFCPNCALYQQTQPMRIAKEPYLGNMSFMTLIWTSEILCKPGVATSLQEMGAQGFEVWDVLLHKTSQPVENVRQIFIPTIASPGVVIEDDLQRKTCPVCGVTKYYQHLKGVMNIRRESLPANTDFMLTHEWFGHGYLAWREILVSNRVARFILDKGWKGVRFKVVDLV